MDYRTAFRGVWAGEATAAVAPAEPARASVDASTIAYRFNWEWCFDPDNGAEGDTSWWWARSVRVDPNEVIADDGEGHLWSVVFTTDGTDAITWSAAQRVAETYTPVSASEGAVATAVVQRRRQRALASNLDRPDRGQSARPPAAAESATNEEDRPMTDEQRRTLALSLGLAEDASEADIHQHAAQQAAANPEPEETHEVEPVEVPAETSELVAASTASPETVSVDRAQWERTQRDAQAGAAAARAQESSRLDGIADAAVRDGRIAPSSRDSWRASIDPGENPDSATSARATAEQTRLAALVTNQVPISERGSVPDPSAPAAASLSRALAASGVKNGRSGAAQREVIRRG